MEMCVPRANLRTRWLASQPGARAGRTTAGGLYGVWWRHPAFPRLRG